MARSAMFISAFMVRTPEKVKVDKAGFKSKLTCKQSTLEWSSAGGVPGRARACHLAAKALITRAKKSSTRFLCDARALPGGIAESPHRRHSAMLKFAAGDT